MSLFAVAGSNEVRVSWSVVDEAQVEDPVWFAVVVRQGDSPVRKVKVDAPASDVVITGLRNGVEASFEVFAVTRNGSSEPAGPVVATPVTGVEGEVAGLLVGFAPGVEVMAGQPLVPGEQLLVGVDLTVSTVVTEESTLVNLDEAVSIEAAQEMANRLATDPAIAWAEPDRFLFTASVESEFAQVVVVPEDQRYAADQWNLWDTFGVGVGAGSSEMTQAWANGTGDGATVAVIDTGITPHPDLDNQIVAGYDFVSNPEQLAGSRQPKAPPVPFDGDSQDVARFGALGWDADPSDPGDWRAVGPVRDSSWHGTKVAGVIAAQAGNSEGIAGVAPLAKIQPIRALSWRGGLLSDIAASITWASGGDVTGVPINQTPAGVINLSLAAETLCPTALQDAIDGARSKGAVVIAAAGNANGDVDKFTPGNCQGVITVAATDREGRRAPYSNYGERIDAAAPGGNIPVDGGILTTVNDGPTDSQAPAWASSEGTSLAAAHVSGAAAILKGQDSTLTPDAVEKLITGSVRPFAAGGCDVDTIKSCGSGIAVLAQISAVGTSRLILERSAVGTAAGSAFTSQPRLNIVNEENTIVIADNLTIVTASVSTGGTLVGTVTATAVAGVVTFANLGISGIAGTAYTITFSSGSLISATQVITATTGPPTRLTAVSATVQTLTVATVVADSPALRVTDSAGNAVAGVSVTFQWTVRTGTFYSSQPGSLSGANAVSVDSGIAAVTSWRLPGPGGVNRIEATATGVAGQSVRFTVFAIAGPLNSFSINYLSIPSPAYAGNTVGMRVSADDLYGNRLVDYQGPITLTSSQWSGERLVNITSNGYVDVNQVFTYTTENEGTWSTWIDVTDGTIRTRSNGVFGMRPLAPSGLVLVLPGETFAPGTESGKVGTARTTAGTFTVKVYQVDSFGNQSHDGYRNESTIDLYVNGYNWSGPTASLPYTARRSGIWTTTLSWTTATPALRIIAAQSSSTRGTCCASLGTNEDTLEVVAGAPVRLSGPNWTPSVSVGSFFSPAPRAFISDQYGNLVADASSVDITVSSQNADVSLTGTLTMSTSGGIATFSDLRYFGPTTLQSLRYTAPGLLAGGSGGFTPSAGSAAALRSTVTLSRPSLIAGGDVVSTVTVLAYDASGNRVYRGGESVDIQSTIGIVGPVTDNANGTYTASLSPGTDVGVGQVTALINGSLTSSKSVTITGPATRLSRTTSSVGSAAGSAFSTQPRITLLDDADTVIGGDDSTVVVASVSVGATLVGTTSATASRGIATFTNLGISGVAGTAYLVTYSSGGLTVATQTVTVTTGPAAAISLSTGNGQTAVAGVSVATTPTVLVTDSGGNPVANVVVNFAIASGGGRLVTYQPQPTFNAPSDSFGKASPPAWVLGTVVGANAMTASVAGLVGNPVTFTATSIPGPMVGFRVRGTNGISNFCATPCVAGTEQAGRVSAVDVNGNNVAEFTGTVALTSSAWIGAVSVDITTNSFEHFAVTPTRAGSWDVRASSGATVTTSASGTFVVAAGAASKLQVILTGEVAAPGSVIGQTGTPTAVIAGTAWVFLANVVDDNWNIVTTGARTLRVTSDDSAAVLPVDASTNAGQRGFWMTLKTTGPQTITVTDQSSLPITPGISASVLVTPGIANSLRVVTEPVAGAAGSLLSTQPAVEIIDAFGNRATNSTASVSVVQQGGPGWNVASLTTEALGSSIDVAYGNGRWVSVGGANGRIVTSTDGRNWRLASSPRFPLPMNAVAYGNGRWTAVGFPGQIAISANGVDWEAVASPIARADYRDIAFGGGKWIAVNGEAFNSAAAFSTNGITWTASSIPYATYGWKRIEYGDGKFLAMIDAHVIGPTFSSADGVAWTSAGSVSGITDMAFGNGMWVGTGPGNVSTSIDGHVWTKVNSNTFGPIAFGDGIFRAASSGSTRTSIDGASWSERSTLPNSNTPQAIEYGGGIWVAGLGSYSPYFAWSHAGLGGTKTLAAVAGVVTWEDLNFIGSSTATTILDYTMNGSTVFASSNIRPATAAASSLGSQLTSSASMISVTGSTTVITMQAKDLYGNNISSGGANVTMSITLGTLSAVTDNNDGTYTATLTPSSTPGSATVTATFNGEALVSTATVIIDAGPASTLTLTQESVGTLAGAAFTTAPKITIYDASGFVRTNDNSTVINASISTGGILVGSVAATAVAGVATFSTLGITGTARSEYLITYSSGSLTTASQEVTVTTGAAKTITLNAGDGQTTAPGTFVAITPSVMIRDAGNNVVAGQAVTFAVATGAGTVVGASAVSDAFGIASVNSWQLGRSPGGNSVTATVTGLVGSPVTFTATGVQIPQTIMFSTLPARTFGDVAFNVGATATSGLIVTFGSLTESVCSISDTTVTIKTGGTCTIRAGQAGNTQIAVAPIVDQSFAVAKIEQAPLIVSTVSGTFGTSLLLSTSGGTSTGAVSFVASNGPDTTGCLVTGASLTTTSWGTCIVTATKATSASYFATSSVAATVSIAKRPITVTADAKTVNFGSAVTQSTTLTGTLAYSDTRSAVTYAYQGTGVTTYGPSATIPTGGGTYSVTPSALIFSAGSSHNYVITYLSAVVTINRSSQTITFAQPAGATFAVAPFSVAPSSTSGLPVTLTSSTPLVCTTSGFIVTVVGAGSCGLAAVQTGNANYLPATAVLRTFTVARANQPTLSMISRATAAYGEVIPLATAGGAGTGAVTYSVVTGTCTYASGVLTLGNADSTCQVRASKAADTEYNAAVSSTQTINTTRADQSLAITSAIPANPLPNGTYSLVTSTLSSATGSASGVVPSLSVTGACSLAGSVVTFTVTGTCIVTAIAGANTNFNAASPTTQTINVGAISQTITFAGSSDVEFDSPRFTLNGTATSDLGVTFMRGAGTSNSACSVSSSGLVLVLAVGICEITASQVGDAQYAPALDVTRAFRVLPALPSAPTITSTSMSAQAITVEFTDPAYLGGVPVSAYQLTATPTGPGSIVTNSACTASPCIVAGLLNGTEYSVEVAAINEAGVGPESGASSPITPATAALPVGSLAAAPGDGSVELTWSGLTPMQRGGGIFSRYEVHKRAAGSSAWTLVTDSLIDPSTTDSTVTALVNGTSHEFRIVVITEANGIEISGHPALVDEYSSTVPSVVESLGVVVIEPDELIVSWSAPVSDGGSVLSSPNYTVAITTSTPDAAPVTCTPVGVELSCVAQGLSHAATYSFSVVANNRMGSSVPSTFRYEVPSSDATLSDLVVESLSGSVPIAPAFDPQTLTYSATVTNGVTSVMLTPTAASADADVMIDGELVISGSESDEIPLNIGLTRIDVVVTAMDQRFSKIYAIDVTRAGPPTAGGGPSVGIPIAPPAALMSGSAIGAVLQGGVPRRDVVLSRNATSSGWDAVASDFALSVETMSSTGGPVALGPDGTMRVEPRGRVMGSGTGYSPGTDLAVFAIPVSRPFSARSASGAVYLGSVVASASGAVTMNMGISPDFVLGYYVLQLNGIVSGEEVLSVNLRLTVTELAKLTSISMQRSGFFQPRSAQMSPNGTRKIAAIVSRIHENAGMVKIAVSAVSVSLETPGANLALARARAAALVQELNQNGVAGQFTVSVLTPRSLATRQMISSVRPLTTLTLSVQPLG